MIDLYMTKTRPSAITKEKKKKTKQYYTPTQYSSQRKEPENASAHLKEVDLLCGGL